MRSNIVQPAGCVPLEGICSHPIPSHGLTSGSLTTLAVVGVVTAAVTVLLTVSIIVWGKLRAQRDHHRFAELAIRELGCVSAVDAVARLTLSYTNPITVGDELRALAAVFRATDRDSGRPD